MERYRSEDPNHWHDQLGLIELTQRAATLYSSASDSEKREMVQMMCSNIKFDGDKLEPLFRKPFDSLMVMTDFEGNKKAAFLAKSGVPSTWRRQGIQPYAA